MNFFSSDVYLAALKDVYFPDRPGGPTPIEVAGKLYRVLVTGDRHVAADVPFLDFFEETRKGDGVPPRRVAYLPHVCHGRVTYEEWMAGNLAASYVPSPLVDLTTFPTWDDFLRTIRPGATPPFGRTVQRRRKKIEREIGALTLAVHDEDPAALRAAMQWKSAQYVASQYVDLFALPKNVRLFEELARRGLLTVSTLRAKGHIAAVHIGIVWERRWYSWVPTYDLKLANYSPGMILLEFMLKEAYARGHREFDLLVGGELYKWPISTHVRLVGPAGTPSLHNRVWPPLRARLIQHVRARPELHAQLQDLKRRALQWHLSR